ncbi:Protein held out wings [Harpegnathos saltator]|uniref:Protein held out wings n=1 Tax=Harpegnathos saltator TaxID=610380 RepID=E2C9E7_HARSA|nr:Protein held out wings [Harpegnathos saltator]
MCDNTNTTTQSIADYLSQLLKDRKQLAAFPNVFIHVERLLDEGELLSFCSFVISYLDRSYLSPPLFLSDGPAIFPRRQSRISIHEL